MERAVKVACVQVEPVIFDRDATIEKVATLAREIAAEGAALAVFPETFVPVYPSSRWARFLAGSGEAKETFGPRASRSRSPAQRLSVSARSRATQGSGSRSGQTSSTAARSTTRSSSTTRA